MQKLPEKNLLFKNKLHWLSPANSLHRHQEIQIWIRELLKKRCPSANSIFHRRGRIPKAVSSQRRPPKPDSPFLRIVGNFKPFWLLWVRALHLVRPFYLSYFKRETVIAKWLMGEMGNGWILAIKMYEKTTKWKFRKKTRVPVPIFWFIQE